jgi:terminase large subunit-like protein
VAWKGVKPGGRSSFTQNFKMSAGPTPEVRHRLRIPGAVEWAREVLHFEPDEKQQLVLSSNTQRGILNCTRQWGKSTVCAIKAVHYAHFHPDSLVVVASPSLRQSGEFLRKARKAVATLEIRVRGDGENKCSILLPNGARIVGLPENEDTIRGFSQVGLLIIDEAARVSDPMYHALRPMLAVGGGSLWLMSTPNGQSGFFYREWSGNRHWTRIQATAEECPRIPEQFLQEERESLGEEVYRQEYCCDFVSGEGTLFDEAQIRSRLSYRLEPLW